MTIKAEDKGTQSAPVDPWVDPWRVWSESKSKQIIVLPIKCSTVKKIDDISGKVVSGEIVIGMFVSLAFIVITHNNINSRILCFGVVVMECVFIIFGLGVIVDWISSRIPRLECIKD